MYLSFFINFSLNIKYRKILANDTIAEEDKANPINVILPKKKDQISLKFLDGTLSILSTYT
jgi:hypothetical protein